MKIQIKNRFNDNIIFETDVETIGQAVKAALAARSNLFEANLSGADLSRANLSGADLSRSNLYGADLSRADLEKIRQKTTIVPEGELVGWKKLKDGIICKLKIPAESKRVGGTVGRKCRCEFAIVLEGEGKGKHNGMEYKIGEKVVADSFDDNPLVECSHGIHFFISRLEAEEYD